MSIQLGSLFYGDLHILSGNEPLYHGLGDLYVNNNSNLKNININGNVSVTSNNIFINNNIIINTSGTFLNDTNIFIGNSTISNNVFIGNPNNITSFLGDVYIQGTLTSINSTNVNIDDNIIVLNNAPNLLSDSGIAIRRYQTANDISQGDIIQDNPEEENILVSATINTLTLAPTSSNVNNYYKDWWIYIYNGTGNGQVRKIKSYDSVTKIASIYDSIDQSTFNYNPLQGLDFTIIPNNTSNYRLYSCNYTMNIWDESNNEFAFICSNLSPTKGSVSINHYTNVHLNNLNCNTINNATADTLITITLNNTINIPVNIPLNKNWGLYQIMIEPTENYSEQSIAVFYIGRKNTILSNGFVNSLLSINGMYNEQLGIIWNANTLPQIYYKKMPIGLLGNSIFKVKIISI